MGDYYTPQEINGSFQKQTSLTAKDKIAILFGELGTSGTRDMLQYFSTKEIKKIRRALQNTPNHISISRENRVLEEAMDYGFRHRITDMNMVKMQTAYYAAQAREDEKKQFRKDMMDNAENVANILKLWMDEGK